MKARSFLEKAIETLVERGGQYESGQDENSMAEIVALQCRLIGDRDADYEGMTELEGWCFMLALKLVRLRKGIEQGKASKDSIVDLLGYAAKMGECLFADEGEPIDPSKLAHPGMCGFGPLQGNEGPTYDIPPAYERERQDSIAEFGEAPSARLPLLNEKDCQHLSCTLQDIEDRLVVACDDCPKQFTAQEFVDNGYDVTVKF